MVEDHGYGVDDDHEDVGTDDIEDIEDKDSVDEYSADDQYHQCLHLHEMQMTKARMMMRKIAKQR